jgi:hypothetical protein
MRIISKGIIDYYEKFLLVLEPNESDEMGDRLEFYLNIDNGVRSILWVSGVPPEEITDELILSNISVKYDYHSIISQVESLVNTIPNDGDLGFKVRELINNFNG